MLSQMPYLHWEEVTKLEEAKKVIKEKIEPRGLPGKDKKTARPSKEQELLKDYLYREAPYKYHTFHIRRTLDQFHYHSLDNTDDRDETQTITRYQKVQGEKNEPPVLAMVDQLWMWVLVGPRGHADTVITCFPSKDLFLFSNATDPTGSTDKRLSTSTPDPMGFTDIFRNVLTHTIHEPHAVKSAYDLAGIIASKCSKSFLSHSGAGHYLQFSKIYESAISNIVC